MSKADLALARVCVGWPEARDDLKAAERHFAEAGFKFKLEFFTRCVSAVAVGNAYFEGGTFNGGRTKSLEEQRANPRISREYTQERRLHRLLRQPKQPVCAPSHCGVPESPGRIFKDDVEKRGFLYWMYLALMWGRYTQLQADVNALQNEDVLKSLVANILQDRGRLKVEPQDLEGQGTRSRFYAIAYIVARSRGAVDWFTSVKLYNSNLGKSYGLEDHHIFPQSVLYKNGYKKKESKDRKIGCWS